MREISLKEDWPDIRSVDESECNVFSYYTESMDALTLGCDVTTV